MQTGAVLKMLQLVVLALAVAFASGRLSAWGSPASPVTTLTRLRGWGELRADVWRSLCCALLYSRADERDTGR